MYIEGTSGEWTNFKRSERYAPDAKLRMFNGVRGTGKTTLCMITIKEQWDKGYQTVFSRLYKEHMKEDAFISEFLSGGKRLGIIPNEWVTSKAGVFTDETMTEQVVFFMDINTAFSRQGNEYNRVMTLLLDEYTVRPGELYPANYPKKLHSLIGTLSRGKEGFMSYLFSNWTNVSNPIWATARIYPGKYDVTYFPEQSMSIEICRNGYYNQDMPDDTSEGGRLLKALNGEIMESANEMSNYNLISPRPKNSKPTNIVYMVNNIHYRLWLGEYVYFEESPFNRRVDDLQVADVKLVDHNYSMIPSQTMSRLRKECEQGLMRFKSAECLYNIMSILYQRYS